MTIKEFMKECKGREIYGIRINSFIEMQWRREKNPIIGDHDDNDGKGWMDAEFHMPMSMAHCKRTRIESRDVIGIQRELAEFMDSSMRSMSDDMCKEIMAGHINGRQYGRSEI